MADDVGMYWLYSIRNYKNLDKDRNKMYIEKVDKCDDLRGELKKVLKKDYTGILDFCEKLGGILNKLNTLDIVSFFNNDRCSVVNYWAYDYMFNNFFKDHSTMDILKFLGVLSEFWKEFAGEKSCSLYMFLTTEDYFKLEKTFYHYILDYPNIKLNIESKKFMCTPKLKEYLKNGFEAYKKVKGFCATNPDATYCSLLKGFLEKQDSDDILELECNYDSSGGLNLTGDQERSHSFEQDPTDESQQGFQAFRAADQDESSISSSSTPIAVALPTVGALLTSFIFLKFTPLRSWLHRHFTGNKMFMFNENGEETNTLFEDGYEHSHTYSPTDEHYIHYHAA
ncbi:PIR Superfamily Protein [Plasmodium ovale curtisi]|uniref:PIR Superfamily Protein n=1 Tax=Plasmodium ovale curtisi TaxID=864141 RepID=A0A1A8X954_PLAOA|nr:PIR Superfamily Protein [Plasmodium ovale curtisi]